MENVIDYIKDSKKEQISILDICTGSGCIGISVAKFIKDNNIYSKNLSLTLSDISPEALKIASINAKNLISSSCNYKVVESDLFDGFKNEKFDIITANPPYVSKNEYETLALEVKNEPYNALVSSDNGLFHIKKIIKNAKNHLNPVGLLITEIGENQGKDALDFALQYYNNAKIIKDLANKDRFLRISI